MLLTGNIALVPSTTLTHLVSSCLSDNPGVTAANIISATTAT
jgi:hypothetical protein